MTLRTIKQAKAFSQTIAKGRSTRRPTLPSLTKTEARKLCDQAAATHPITRIAKQQRINDAQHDKQQRNDSADQMAPREHGRPMRP